MKYRLIKRSNPQDNTQQKWYASPVNEGKITKKDITKEIVKISSLSRGEVSNVIENLLEILPKYLLAGKSVGLGEIGTFRLSFSSQGVVAPENFNTNLIEGIKVIFTPGVELKNELKEIKFEKEESDK